ncbi:OmpA/MotB family protein [Holophaga foetida]|uniref:OmpA/MotB family protein n=1 Tax=Holophaga foetida TaxID=35839 RepID=UPI0002473AE5|nr:flagellar motor protein MotB [Holophaga foetida]
MTRVRGFVRKQDLDSLWLITFADLMVQLMAFFAVIYSFSAQDSRKLDEILRSIRRELGVEKAATLGAEAQSGILPGGQGLDPNRAADVEKLLSDLKATDGLDAGTRMRIVSFRGAILFSEGSTTVDAAFMPMVQRISELVVEYPGFTLICEGHAAPGEKGRNGADALELSGIRAQSVTRFLVQKGVVAKGVAAEAHGDSQIEGDPESPEGRALQRRVRFRFQRVAER